MTKKKTTKSKTDDFTIRIHVWKGWPEEQYDNGIFGYATKAKDGSYDVFCINNLAFLGHEIGHVFEDMFGYSPSDELPDKLEAFLTQQGKERLKKERAFDHTLYSR